MKQMENKICASKTRLSMNELGLTNLWDNSQMASLLARKQYRSTRCYAKSTTPDSPSPLWSFMMVITHIGNTTKSHSRYIYGQKKVGLGREAEDDTPPGVVPQSSEVVCQVHGH